MADNTEGGDAPQEVTFKVKSSGDKVHTITMSEAATISDLKAKLSTEEYENIPADRQRLIYSGRVMKNDDALSNYKIKPNNTVHLVKSAASNPAPPAASSSTSAPAVPNVPTNMAAGTANNPLAGLTGARFAGHVPLPSRSMFGADGGMGPPPSADEMARMMSDPSVQQTMNTALDNPDFINMLIQSNPTLRNLPNAREMLQSPFMRQMMTNPDMIRMASQMQGQGGMPAFPAPGATDNTPSDAPSAGNQQGGENAGAGAGAGAGAAGMPQLPPLGMMFPGLGGTGGAGAGGENAGQGEGQGEGAGAGTGGQAPPNPFLSFLNPNAAQGAGGNGNPDLQRSLQELLQNMGGMGGLGGLGGAGSPPAPADNRPPEERYADQLRQLNDMGFFDFDRNIAALRRSGGSVQGAIEFLLEGS